MAAMDARVADKRRSKRFAQARSYKRNLGTGTAPAR